MNAISTWAPHEGERAVCLAVIGLTAEMSKNAGSIAEMAQAAVREIDTKAFSVASVQADPAGAVSRMHSLATLALTAAISLRDRCTQIIGDKSRIIALTIENDGLAVRSILPQQPARAVRPAADLRATASRKAITSAPGETEEAFRKTAAEYRVAAEETRVAAAMTEEAGRAFADYAASVREMTPKDIAADPAAALKAIRQIAKSATDTITTAVKAQRQAAGALDLSAQGAADIAAQERQRRLDESAATELFASVLASPEGPPAGPVLAVDNGPRRH